MFVVCADVRLLFGDLLPPVESEADSIVNLSSISLVVCKHIPVHELNKTSLFSEQKQSNPNRTRRASQQYESNGRISLLVKILLSCLR